MNKIVSLAMLVGGVVLIIIGVNATNSFSSDVSRFFTGSPTDKAVWMLIGGIVASCLGLPGDVAQFKTSVSSAPVGQIESSAHQPMIPNHTRFIVAIREKKKVFVRFYSKTDRGLCTRSNSFA